MANSHTANVQLGIPKEKAKEKTQEALMKAGFRMAKWVGANQAFYAEAPTTLWSWGEDILVRFQENEQGTLVTFTSSCKLSTQIIDWRKNKKNAKKFFQHLDAS